MTRMPVDHVLRAALPWRQPTTTECGQPIAELAADRVLAREDLVRRVRDEGIERASMHTCMTCIGTFRRWPKTWDQDPRERMAREFYGGGQGAPELVDELRAIAVLIANHRPEFDAILAGLGDAGDLAKARNDKRLQRAQAGRPPTTPPKPPAPAPPAKDATVLQLGDRRRKSDL